MKRKMLSALLCASMAATMLAACGGGSTSDTGSANSNGSGSTATEEEGKVLNIYSFNTEFATRVEKCYPDYEKVDDTTGKIGDVTVKWVITANKDNAYQNYLDEQLLAQNDAAADDKIDMFLVEADYALKYVDTDYCIPLADLGLDDSVFADQYQYTKDAVTDSNGKLKGSSWQGCPGALIYNREIAKKVLGSDDPAEVQKAVSDWDTYLATAEKMKEAGYYMTSSVNDPYRVFTNNVSSKWVVDGKINIDDNIKAWVDMSKKMVDAGETNSYELWGDDWSKGFWQDSANVFAYFGPAWFIDFSMSCTEEGSVGANGGWAVTEGPQGFFWGGSWVLAATGTDNPTLVADIIKTMTTDDEVLKSIVKNYSDFVNDTAIMEEFAGDESFGNPYLGGQNPYGVFASGVSSVSLENTSTYDQGCNESFQEAMKNYFDGNATYEEALDLFYKAVVEKYPELSY
ncbi:MAG: ABC transporter substrate-binding protein [Lachnospiraceae bacterium]|nr:ABC transporter substrate-binding protein [Lachnospiraceae bacterium]